MTEITALLILLYGVLLSVNFAGSIASAKELRILAAMCLIVSMVQLVSYWSWGYDMTTKLYPLMVHLPNVLMLVLVLKRPWGVSIVSVLTAYFCCQLPRWVGTMALELWGTSLAYQVGYIISIFPIFFLLQRYFAKAAYQAMTYSNRSLYLFGCLPLFYYVFNYVTTIYTKSLYDGSRMVSEFLPAAMALFYVMFVSLYHNEAMRMSQLKLDNALLAKQSEHAKNEILALQKAREQIAVYQHDMRHHLSLIGNWIDTGEIDKVSEYIRQTQVDIDSIVPVRYCENHAVNLILSSFVAKAKERDVTLYVEASIPEVLHFSETELCTLLSNGLENAISAAAEVDTQQRKVTFSCQPHKGKLLIHIKNPYQGTINMQAGLPQSTRPGHGFGTKSIKMIAERHNGYFSFEAREDQFTLKVVLPFPTIA